MVDNSPTSDLTEPTALLDYAHPSIAGLVAARGWSMLPVFQRIGAVYDYVRDEVAFDLPREFRPLGYLKVAPRWMES